MKENVGWTTMDELSFISNMVQKNQFNPKDCLGLLNGYIAGMKKRTHAEHIDIERCIAHAERCVFDMKNIAKVIA